MASAGTLTVLLCPCWVDVVEAGALAATESYMVAVGEAGALGAAGGMEDNRQSRVDFRCFDSLVLMIFLERVLGCRVCAEM